MHDPLPRLATIADVEGRAFDYVIIGGGTAGCVLANRLSEDPDVSVLVLETGKARFEDQLITGPMGWMRQLFNPEYDWAFPLVPQENSQTVDKVPWSRAKSLGGSSTMNIMAYTKPPKNEMDALEELGNPGWNWTSYQKYANKVERLCVPEPEIMDPGFRSLYNASSVGHDGPLTLSFVPTGTGADGALQESLAHNGIKVIPDALGGDVIGAFKGISTVNPSTGTRMDSATAYLRPVLARANLSVLTEAFVLKIVTAIDEGSADTIARAVEFEYSGKIYSAKVKGEVILSAGSIKSPQILELSGIGNRQILEAAGISCTVDLPGVGENAQEHVACRAPTFCMKDDAGVMSTNMLQDAALMAKQRDALGLKNPYALVIHNFMFAPLQALSPSYDAIIERKEAELALTRSSLSEGLKKQYEIQLRMLKSLTGVDVEIMASPLVLRPFNEPEKSHFTLSGLVARPWSRGYIHISSSDPKRSPKIDPKYFTDSIDLDVLCEAFKFTLRLAETEPLKGLIAYRAVPPESADLSSDERIREFVCSHIITAWHTCGTASMLPRADGGVVSSELKVYGTKNIRVADLSILPLQISVHPQAFVYALAEKAADIFKGTAT